MGPSSITSYGKVLLDSIVLRLDRVRGGSESVAPVGWGRRRHDERKECCNEANRESRAIGPRQRWRTPR
jgi:hypothetical protein